MNSPAAPSAAPEQYVVFLSHNSRDKEDVERIALRLEQEGITTWLDKWDLTPGRSSIQGLEDGITTSRSCIIFYGPAGTGPWHELERHAALVKFVSSGGKYPVIPVLLPGAKEPGKATLPPLLQDVTWIEFNSIEPLAETAFQLLLCGIRGEKPREFYLRQPKTAPTNELPQSIVPHGLRSFGERDSGFFLRLLPGHRDHRGLPESIAFWKDKLEEVDPERTFAVGLLHGPSGCGKSSLVKAGLLPRLVEYVRPIYLEATANDTERQLLAKLRRLFPELPGDDLTAALQAIRDRPEVLGGCKVVLILDQFEQWLHANPIQETAPLVRALRQCDGGILQAVLMVRVDFPLAIHRFLSQLEVRSQDGINTLLVDLFERIHARNVLVEFGRAYGRFSGPVDLTADEEEFLSQALNQLQDDQQHLIAVQLALFADMVRDKPWTGAVLKKLGGATGVGRAFLEENFDAKTANPAHKAHRTAAIAVLKRLLPPSGTELKGTSQPRSVLVATSGYQHKPADFEAVLSILATELRLISPVAPNDVAGESPDATTATEQRYQLTHDYLVPSLRDWLTATDRETPRGRARLVLEERTEQWIRVPLPRNYPSIPEYLRIGTLVPRRQRSDDQQRLMRRATGYYTRRSMLVFGLLTLLIAPKFLWDFCTFQVEFADLAYAQHRAEVVITRKWDPWGKKSRYRLGTHIFKDELPNLDAENKVNQRLTLNTGLTPDWNGLIPLLSDSRLGLVEVEWLDRPISVPRGFFDKNDAVSWGRTTPAVIDALVTLLKDPDRNVRLRAVESMRKLGQHNPAMIDDLVALLKDSDLEVRLCVADFLVQLGKSDSAVIDVLVTLFKGPKHDIFNYLSSNAAAALIQLGESNPAVIDILVTLLKDPDHDIRFRAATSLVQLGQCDSAVIDVLVTQLKDPNRDVFNLRRRDAAESLVQLGQSDPAVIDILVALLKDPDNDIRLHTATLLVRLGKSDPTLIDVLVAPLKDMDDGAFFNIFNQFFSGPAESLEQLGKSDSTVIARLVMLLKDRESRVRSRAAAFLGRLGKSDPAVIDSLLMMLKDQESYVRSSAATSLGWLGKSDPAVIDSLVTLLKDQESHVRSSAATSLGRLGKSDPTVIVPLVMLLKDQDDDVRRCAAASLGLLGKSDPAVIDSLVMLLKDQESHVRSSAATSLVLLGKSDPALIDPLVLLLKDEDDDVRRCATASLVLLGKSAPAVIDALVTLLKDPNWNVRHCAATSLVQLGKNDPAVIDPLVMLLKDEDDDVRLCAAETLGLLGKSDPAVIDPLVVLLKDQDYFFVREAAVAALGQLGQKRDDWTDARMIADLADFDSGVRERAGIVLAYRDDKLKPETRQTVEALRKDSRPWVRQASLHALYHIENRKAELEKQASQKAEAEAAKDN